MNITRRDGPEVLFYETELECPATHDGQLATGFMEMLQELRETYGHPLVVTSCNRSELHNIKINGHPHSLHVYDKPYHDIDGCAAIDVKWPYMASHRTRLIITALDLGWSVGPARRFIHLDRRDLAGMAQRPFGY